ncbi:hypothetical protein LTR95_004658 [Oleoguttula sp. CCFEE 5521]
MASTVDDTVEALRGEYRRPQTENISDFWYYSPSDWEDLLRAAADPKCNKTPGNRLHEFDSSGRMMETSYGTTVDDSAKCKWCRKENVECRIQANGESGRCAYCWVHHKAHCDAGPTKPIKSIKLRKIPSVVLPPKYQQSKQSFKRSHIPSQRAIATDHATPLQVASTLTRATPHQRLSVKTEEVDSESMSPLEFRPRAIKRESEQPSTSLSRGWTEDAANEEIEVMEAELAALRQQALLKRKIFERNQRRGETVEQKRRVTVTVDLTKD